VISFGFSSLDKDKTEAASMLDAAASRFILLPMRFAEDSCFQLNTVAEFKFAPRFRLFAFL
jgi:hypothetical protein